MNIRVVLNTLLVLILLGVVFLHLSGKAPWTSQDEGLEDVVLELKLEDDEPVLLTFICEADGENYVRLCTPPDRISMSPESTKGLSMTMHMFELFFEEGEFTAFKLSQFFGYTDHDTKIVATMLSCEGEVEGEEISGRFARWDRTDHALAQNHPELTTKFRDDAVRLIGGLRESIQAMKDND